MTVFVGQEMVNFPAPQKLDPKISPHGFHTVYDSVCDLFLPHKNSTPRYHPMVFTLFMTVFVGQEKVNFPAPQKLDPKISPHGIHTVYDSVCGAGNCQFSCPTKTRPQDITPWFSHWL